MPFIRPFYGSKTSWFIAKRKVIIVIACGAAEKGVGMLNKKALLVAVVFSLAVLACPLLYSQASGSFSGTVSDKAGAVVVGATVKVTSQGTGISRDAKTNDAGYYLIPLLPVAFYTIHVESQGFQPAEQKDVRLQIDEHRELDFSLLPASVNSTVQVSATEVAIETANPTLGQVITSEEVADLPLNGRNFVQLATLTPGTTASTSPISFFNGAASSEASTRGSFSLSVGGSREQSTDWLLDGNDNNQLDEGGIAIFSSIDDIQEFKVLTYNYSAEYGTHAGPTVLVTTKSGANAFHGALYEYFRNTALDAYTSFPHAQQRLVDEAADRVEGAGAEHRLRCLERAAVMEQRQPPQRALLVGVQQVPGPLDDREQGLMPVGSAAVAAAQQREPVLEPSVDLLDRHGAHLGRGELDRQRQAVKPPDDVDDQRAGLAVQPELRADRRRPVGEQPHGGILVQRRDDEQRLPGDAKRLPAGRHDPQLGAVGEQRVRQVSARVDEMLAVVEDQQGTGVGQPVKQPGARIAAGDQLRAVGQQA